MRDPAETRPGIWTKRSPAAVDPHPRPITPGDLPRNAIGTGHLQAGAVDQLNERTRMPYDPSSGDGAVLTLETGVAGVTGGRIDFVDAADTVQATIAAGTTGAVYQQAKDITLDGYDGAGGVHLKSGLSGAAVDVLNAGNLAVTPATGYRTRLNGVVERYGHQISRGAVEEYQETGTKQIVAFGGGTRTAAAGQFFYIAVPWPRIYVNPTTLAVVNPVVGNVALVSMVASANYTAASFSVVAVDAYGCLIRVTFTATATAASYVYGRLSCY